MTSKLLFKAKTVEGFTIKSLIEVLQNILTDVCFVFDSTGITLLTVDNKVPPHLLVHLTLNSVAFDEYFCQKQISVGVNLAHMYKMLKTIKKKDHIQLYISKDEPGLLGIDTTQAETGQVSTSCIKIQKLSQVSAGIPNDYGHPIHISTSAYQKMCKDMQSISNTTFVYCKGNYLEFSCKVEGLYNRAIPFGDKEDLDDSDDYDYEDSFHTKTLGQLIKVCGLNARMQIFPPLPGLAYESPLKISINTGQLGKLEIYIKSISQINGDE